MASPEDTSAPQKGLISDDLPSNLQRVRRLRERGRYADAVTELEELYHRFGRDSQLVVELGESLFLQGYFRRAVRVFEEHLIYWDWRRDLTAAAGEIICGLARFYETSQFKESLHHAEKVYNSFISGDQSEVINNATVWLFPPLGTCEGSDIQKDQDRNLLLPFLEPGGRMWADELLPHP